MAKNIVNQIRKATRRKFSAEQKIRIVLEGLRGWVPISELARREGIVLQISRRSADSRERLLVYPVAPQHKKPGVVEVPQVIG